MVLRPLEARFDQVDFALRCSAIRQNGLDYMERYMSTDAGQALYYALWKDLISRDPKEIVRELLADTDRGALLRETSPVFYVVAGVEREQALARAREER